MHIYRRRALHPWQAIIKENSTEASGLQKPGAGSSQEEFPHALREIWNRERIKADLILLFMQSKSCESSSSLQHNVLC